MLKATLFDIETKKDQQVDDELSMSSIDRVYLTLDLMDVCLALSPDKTLHQKDDEINWITLKFVDAKSNP